MQLLSAPHCSHLTLTHFIHNPIVSLFQILLSPQAGFDYKHKKKKISISITKLVYKSKKRERDNKNESNSKVNKRKRVGLATDVQLLSVFSRNLLRKRICALYSLSLVFRSTLTYMVEVC